MNSSKAAIQTPTSVFDDFYYFKQMRLKITMALNQKIKVKNLKI